MDNRENTENREKTGLGRREFIGTAAAALFAGVVLQITGCGTEEDDAPAVSGDAVGTVSNNHGHSARITKVTLDAGGGVTLDIEGSAGHSHTVELTAQDVANIKGLVTHVMKSSTTTNAHSHSVMFN